MDSLVVVRNILIMLLFLDVQDDTDQAWREQLIEEIIHLWYSVSIPATLQRRLQTRILPVIRHLRESMRLGLRGCIGRQNHVLILDLTPEVWDQLEQCCDQPRMSQSKAKRLRNRCLRAPGEIDLHEQDFYMAAIAHARVAKLKFVKEGVLLPFGDKGFENGIPNP
jgi:hypothetical protein